jgi:DNA replication protein DnaC
MVVSFNKINKSSKSVLEPKKISSDLGQEKKCIKNLVLSGQSIFLTGAAGTGKSYLLRNIISELEKKYGKNEIGITSLSGVASNIIGGTTLASFLGLGMTYHLSEKKLLTKILSSSYSKNN